MKFRLLIALVVGLALVAAGGFAWTASRPDAFALAEFSVQNLSCGSCVQNIQNALGGVKGVGAVEVSVTSSRARVEYAPARIDAATIAGRITEAGYPAVLSQDLSAADYQALREDEARLADRFVGRIGQKLVSREAFAAALSRRESEAAAPKQGLLKNVWGEILQREILLAAAEKNGVVVQEGEVDLELQKLQAASADFAAVVQARYGSEEEFRRQLKEDLIIRRNIDEHVLQGESDQGRARQKIDLWLRELAAAVPVVIFDPALRAAVVGGGKGCGGGCCG
ncbi:MAG TPA: cation transporter [Desulfuromonadales bacterium]|nr:cation transporter [Desulfuromonadales bacterium]